MTWRWSVLLLLPTACTGLGEIVVDLRTDLVPGIEVTGVEISLDDGPPTAHVPSGSGDYVRGVRVASFASVEPGTHRLVVRLVRGVDEIAVRPVTVRVTSTTGVTVVITRDCRGVTCPSDDPAKVACVGGTCVDPSCTPETPELCPASACSADAECPARDPCSIASCVDAVCLYEDAGSCAPGQYCSPESGCVAELGPFGPASSVSPLSDSADDDDPTATGDLLEIYFSTSRSDGAGADDIWASTRPSVDVDFEPPAPVVELNTADDETAPELSSDGLTLVFVSSRPGLGRRDIYITTRPSRTATWETPTRIDVVSTSADETAPTFDATMRRMVFNNRASGESQLWEATRDDPAGDFRPATPLVELDEAGSESAPHLDAAGLLLHFTSTRAGQGMDIFRTVRPSLDAPFATPVVVMELQTSADETDPWVSPDGRTIFFSTDQDGDSEIYSAVR